MTAKTSRGLASKERARIMHMDRQYRAKAAQYTHLLKTTISAAEAREFRMLEQSYIALANNDEWLKDNVEKTLGQTTPDSWYNDVNLTRHKKYTLPKKIQQLFDDAGSRAGVVQTARLRRQVARFLDKHRDHDFN
jgi:hypothetical protein